MKLARWLSRPSGFCVGGLSSVSLTADSSRCGGSLWGFCLQACPYPNAVKVAAALSAAVTTTKQQENAPISQAEPPMQKHAIQTPAALRERGVWGERRFSQRSGLSPQNLPYYSLFGRAVPAGTTKGRSSSGGFAIALWKPSPTHSSDYVKASVGRSRRLCQPP